MSVVDHIRELVEPALSAEGLELFDVEFGGGRVLILADRPGGVDLEALTRATHRISALFDRDDPVPGGQYLLEISSPGLERRLRTPDHFRRFAGATVSVKTRAGVEGDRRVRGELADVDDLGFTVDGRRLAFGDVERAQTVFDWGPTPRPPGPPKRVKRSQARATPTTVAAGAQPRRTTTSDHEASGR